MPDSLAAIEEGVHKSTDVAASVREEPDRAIEQDVEERFEFVGDLNLSLGIAERMG